MFSIHGNGNNRIVILFAGTRVIQVFATDADGNGPAGLVKYSIVSKHNKFKIDPNTGWLTTNAVSPRCY